MAKLIEITGKTISGEWGFDDTEGIGIPVLRTTNFTNEGFIDYQNVVTRIIKKQNISEKFLRSGDIIIEKSGGSDKQPVGRVVYYDGPDNTYLFNNFTGVLRVKDPSKWYPKYIFYALFTNYWRGGTRRFENKTTGLHNLKTDDYVARFGIAEIPLDQQICICNTLDKIHLLIGSRKKQLTKMDDLIKARFVEMFGDPLLNDRGWPCKRIGDLFEVISRGKQPTYVEHSTVRVINQACVYWDRINMDNAKYHDDQSSKKMLPISEYSILINSTGTGTLGRCNVFPELRDDYVYVVDSHVTTLQESSEINAWFFKWFFQHNGIQAKIYSECVNGSTNQIELSREKLSNAMMIVPPIELQNQFAEFVIETNKLKLTLFRYNVMEYKCE